MMNRVRTLGGVAGGQGVGDGGGDGGGHRRVHGVLEFETERGATTQNNNTVGLEKGREREGGG
jgi:hypothetical protein